MTRIILETLSPDQMRLPCYRQDGCGDWFRDAAGDVRIQFASTADPMTDAESFLILLHELVEMRICAADGVTQAAVDAFDTQFEAERAAGQHEGGEEPGDDLRAPYCRQHRRAMLVEHMVAEFLGLEGYGVVK